MIDTNTEKTVKREASLPQNVIMENRKLLNISGVSDIDSFDENRVILFTALGGMTVKGRDLHVCRLNVESGEINITGEISAVIYTEPEKRSGNILSRIFK